MKKEREDVKLIKETIKELKPQLTQFKKLKKTTYVRFKIKKLIERIQRNERWIKELNSL